MVHPLTPKRQVYIAGPMTGYPDDNHPAFRRAEQFLKGQGISYLSPVDSPRFERIMYEDYIRSGIDMLLRCTDIMLLEGWTKSMGASLEVLNALRMGHKFHLFTVPNGKPIITSFSPGHIASQLKLSVLVRDLIQP